MPRNFPSWLQAYEEYTRHSEAPLRFRIFTGVSTIAGALRRRVWIDEHIFQWVPNFYTILVAPPGIVGKTTTISIGMDMLKEIEGVRLGPNILTWQSLAQTMAQARLLEPIPGTDDFMEMSCLTFASGEFGNLLDPQDKNMIDLLVSLWDGRLETIKKTTKTQGSDEIVNPWINIIACTTPGWMRDNLPHYFMSGGFASRCIFLYADEKARYVAYPSMELESRAAAADVRARLVEDLQHIAKLYGTYELSAEAKSWGQEWYHSFWSNTPEHLNDERLAGYASRKQTHIHKLAMVMAASESDDMVISAGNLQAAEKIITSLEEEMGKLYQRMGMSAEGRNVDLIVSFVKRLRYVNKQRLYDYMHTMLGPKQFDEALVGAIRTGRVSVSQVGSEIFLADTTPQKPGRGRPAEKRSDEYPGKSEYTGAAGPDPSKASA